jgi:HK97 family phage portal protein
VIIATRGGQNRELRFGELGAFIPPPGSRVALEGGGFGYGGELSIPAVASAIRLIAESVGSFVLRVFEGDAEQRRPVANAPQAALFQDPAEESTSFNLWEDVATSVETSGNAFIWKVMVGGRVAELMSVPAEYCRVFRRKPGGPKVIEARIGAETRDITANVIHVRGWSPVQNASGRSTIDLHSRVLHGMVTLEEFRGRFFDADSTPNLVITHPGNPTKEQRSDFREAWNARHRGPDGEKMGLLWGGASVQQLTSTLKDAQAAEMSASDVKDVARMFRIFPAVLLTAETEARLPDAEVVGDLFYRFTLMPRLRRIERAISSDRDVFPDARRYAHFDVSEIVRGNITTSSGKVHMLKQVGVMTANEGRAEIGLPPSTDPSADVLQQTPVGGAPNDAAPAQLSPGEPSTSDPTPV